MGRKTAAKQNIPPIRCGLAIAVALGSIVAYGYLLLGGVGEGAARRAIELGRGVIVNDYPSSREAFLPLLARSQVAAALAMPVVSLDQLEVEDHGPGIPEDELPRIWESFFRGERARNSPNRGSGLGLAVVRQLTELHGGRVEAMSELGQGTTFRIWLPTAPPSQPLVQPEPACPENVASGLDLKGISV